MALSQSAALMGDVPHRRARSGLGPLGRKRLQGGTEAEPPPGIDCLTPAPTQSVLYIRFPSFAQSANNAGKRMNEDMSVQILLYCCKNLKIFRKKWMSEVGSSAFSSITFIYFMFFFVALLPFLV